MIDSLVESVLSSRIRNPILVSLLIVGIIGCADESARKDNSTLRAKLDALSSEKSKTDGELIKRDSELAATKERLAEAKSMLEARLAEAKSAFEELKNQNTGLRESNIKYSIQLTELSERQKASELFIKNQKERISELESALQKATTTPRKGELRGVVTYYFNDNYGDKPDVGAEIHIFPESAYTNFDYKNQLAHGFGDDIVLWSSTVHGEKTIHVTADGNGSFKRSLPPDRYIAVIRSNHRRGTTGLELTMGKIKISAFTIKGDDEVIVNSNFLP